MNKFFKSKQQAPQVAAPVEPVPRSMEEINKTYSELCGRAGQLQYGIKIYQEQLDQINSAIKNVAAEGDARKNLDAKQAEVKND